MTDRVREGDVTLACLHRQIIELRCLGLNRAGEHHIASGRSKTIIGGVNRHVAIESRRATEGDCFAVTGMCAIGRDHARGRIGLYAGRGDITQGDVGRGQRQILATRDFVLKLDVATGRAGGHHDGACKRSRPVGKRDICS